MERKDKEPNVFLRIIVALTFASIVFLLVGYLANSDTISSIDELKIAFKIVGFITLAGAAVSVVVYLCKAKKQSKTNASNEIKVSKTNSSNETNDANVSKPREATKDELESKKKFMEIMKAKNITFFEAVWEYFVSIGAVEKFKEKYITQLEYDGLEDSLEGLTEKKVALVKEALNKKIEELKTNKYDGVFFETFKAEVKQEIEMSNQYAQYGEMNGFVLGGMTPDVYLEQLFDSSCGALFFFSPEINWTKGKPEIKLDVDNGTIDWQPFD